MIKKKTHSGAKKRFKLTKNGKIKYSKSRRRHHLTLKSTRTKRGLRCGGYLDASNTRHIKPIL
jgi:large subunit ribosomal protein L35